MTKYIIRNTILFMILISLIVVSATGLSYIASGIAYEQQRDATMRSVSAGLPSQDILIQVSDPIIPSMVATPSD